jgi:hypothetical protein
MAILRKATDQRAEKGTGRRAAADPQYLEQLTQLVPGDAGEVELEEGDDQRTVKRSVTRAAKQLNKPIRWHEQGGNVLVFQVLTDEQAQKRELRRGRKQGMNDDIVPNSAESIIEDAPAS